MGRPPATGVPAGRGTGTQTPRDDRARTRGRTVSAREGGRRPETRRCPRISGPRGDEHPLLQPPVCGTVVAAPTQRRGHGSPRGEQPPSFRVPEGRSSGPSPAAARPEPPPRGQAHWAPTSDVRVPFAEGLASPAPFPPVVPPRAAGDGHRGGRGCVWVWALLLPPASTPRALPAHLTLESFPLVLAYFFWGRISFLVIHCFSSPLPPSPFPCIFFLSLRQSFCFCFNFF